MGTGVFRAPPVLLRRVSGSNREVRQDHGNSGYVGDHHTAFVDNHQPV